MRAVILCLLGVSLACAQVQTVAVSKQPPNQAATTLTFYDANQNPQYICKAISIQQPYNWGVTATFGYGTLTSIVVSSNVGTVTTSANHGLVVNNQVAVSGSTTSALNGNYSVQTTGSTTTFTITTSGVSDGTYNNAPLRVTTTAPRTNANPGIWSIEQFTYNASNNPTADQFANGNTAHTNSCDSRATLSYQ